MDRTGSHAEKTVPLLLAGQDGQGATGQGQGRGQGSPTTLRSWG